MPQPGIDLVPKVSRTTRQLRQDIMGTPRQHGGTKRIRYDILATWMIAVLGIASAATAEAQLFKCVGPEGKVSYQQSRCAQGSTETSVSVPGPLVAPDTTGASRSPWGAFGITGGRVVEVPMPAGVESQQPTADRCANTPMGPPAPLPASAARLAGANRVLLENRCGVPTRPTEAATATAKRLGEAGDADALTVIVDLGSDELRREYGFGFAMRTDAVPPAIERVILANLNDDKAGELLARLLQGSTATMKCTSRYASRELFDALQARFVKRWEPTVASALTCSSLTDVDGTLAAALAEARNPLAAQPLVYYFKERRAPVAIPALVAIQSAIPLPRDNNLVHAVVNDALLATGGDDALRAVDARIQWLVQNAAVRNASSEASSLIASLGASPPDSRIPYESVRALAKAFPQPSMQHGYAKWAEKWRMREAIPDLYAMIPTEAGPAAASAILQIGSADDWKKLDRLIAANAQSAFWTSSQTKPLREQISLAATGPETFGTQRAERDRRQAFEDARVRLMNERNALAEGGKNDPKRYVALEEELLRRGARLAQEYSDRTTDASNLRAEIIAGYGRLAGYRRFTQRDPRGAVESYERGIALQFDPAGGAADPKVILRLGKADTLRFDLNDRAGALREYREALEIVSRVQRSDNGAEAALLSLAVAWLKAEIAFLDGGKRTPEPDDLNCEGIPMVIVYGRGLLAMGDPQLEAIFHDVLPPGAGLDRGELARRLQALTPTPVHMLATVDWWPSLGTADKVASFLRKHDPSGFLTACVLSVAEMLPSAKSSFARPERGERPSADGLWSAAEVRLMQGVASLVGAPTARVAEARKQLADPETTWRTFVAALRAADLPAVRRCLTPEMRQKAERVFSQMSAAELRAMADSFTDFKVTGKRETYGTAVVTAKGRGGLIHFINAGGEWRIAEM